MLAPKELEPFEPAAADITVAEEVQPELVAAELEAHLRSHTLAELVAEVDPVVSYHCYYSMRFLKALL